MDRRSCFPQKAGNIAQRPNLFLALGDQLLDAAGGFLPGIYNALLVCLDLLAGLGHHLAGPCDTRLGSQLLTTLHQRAHFFVHFQVAGDGVKEANQREFQSSPTFAPLWAGLGQVEPAQSFKVRLSPVEQFVGDFFGKRGMVEQGDHLCGDSVRIAGVEVLFVIVDQFFPRCRHSPLDGSFQGRRVLALHDCQCALDALRKLRRFFHTGAGQSFGCAAQQCLDKKSQKHSVLPRLITIRCNALYHESER